MKYLGLGDASHEGASAWPGRAPTDAYGTKRHSDSIEAHGPAMRGRNHLRSVFVAAVAVER